MYGRRGMRSITAGIAGLLIAAGLVAISPSTASAAVAPPKVADGAVNAIAAIGSKIYVGGTFTKLTLPDGSTVNRSGLYAYDSATGALDTSFAPVLSIPNVTSIAAASDGQSVFIGGTFATVNGTTQRRLARISVGGSLVTTFKPNVNARVDRISVTGSRVFIGGTFTQVANAPHTRIAEVSATTGAPASGFNAQIMGSAAIGGFVSVEGMDLTPDGQKLVIAHNGTQVDGQDRYGVAVIDISGTQARLDPWYTNFWKDQLFRNGGMVRVTDLAISPDGSWFATTNTGGDRPPTNDAVQRFNLGGAGPVAPAWITRQFDSAYAVEIGADGAVYTGGHFRYTEAPGSAEPYPGDANVNYGFGPAGGAVVLGDQVVERGQLGALNPSTGKALNWYHTANGQHGITALLVSGKRLFIGQDGTKVDGYTVGRLGSAPTTDAPRDTTKPLSEVSSPLMGAVLPVGARTITGTATAPGGVASVAVEIKQSGKWLTQAGTLSSTYVAWPATVASPQATSTAWSLNVTLPAGAFTIMPRAKDVAKVQEPVRYTVPVTMVDTTNAPPSISVTSPTANQQDFASRTITVSGTATDPDGVSAVQVSFFNSTAQQYLSGNNTLGDFTAFSATLGTPNGSTTSWAYTTTVPDGAYTLFVNAVDGKGASLPRAVSTSFTMAPGNVAPSVTIDSPVTGGALGSSFTITGTATDDAGVSRVQFRLADTRFGLGIQTGGGFGLSPTATATLASPGAKTTTWSYVVNSLPIGVYSLTAWAEDGAGVQTPSASRPVVTGLERRPAGAVTPEPATAIKLPAVATFRPTTLTVPLSGTAGYGGGVARVKLVVFDELAGKWMAPDGTMGSNFAFIDSPVASPGATSTNWSKSLVLPNAGKWTVQALAEGNDGNLDWSATGAKNTYLVYPGDADPTLEWNSPTDGLAITGTTIATGGRAFDDVGVSKVQVRFTTTANATIGLADIQGTIGAPTWINAFVTNAGGPATNWYYTTPNLPKGSWNVEVKVIDSVGKATLTVAKRTVTLS